MSRQIDLTKPLSDEDREYLESRGRLDVIQRMDENFAYPTTNDAFGSSPDGKSGHLNENVTEAPSPTLTPQTGQTPSSGDSEGGDEEDYDDAEAWPYDDLKAEVKARKDDGAEDAPALNSPRETLVAWLKEDDARE